MLDLESLSTRSNAVIAAIGAVEFDFETAQTGRVFYVKIDIQSCLDAGLIVDGATLAWWFNQPDETRLELLQNTVNISVALCELIKFIKAAHPEVLIWDNSPKFDLTKIENAFNAFQLTTPWQHTQERCVRTYQVDMPEIKANYPRIGNAHNALSDCLHQIGYTTQVYQEKQKKYHE